MIKIQNNYPGFSSLRIHVRRKTGRWLKGGEEVNLALKPGDKVTITCPDAFEEEKYNATGH